MIKVTKPTKKQLDANAEKMKVVAEKFKELSNLTKQHEHTN